MNGTPRRTRTSDLRIRNHAGGVKLDPMSWGSPDPKRTCVGRKFPGSHAIEGTFGRFWAQSSLESSLRDRTRETTGSEPHDSGFPDYLTLMIQLTATLIGRVSPLRGPEAGNVREDEMLLMESPPRGCPVSGRITEPNSTS